MRAWFELRPAAGRSRCWTKCSAGRRGPYLQRTAEVLQQRVSLDGWRRRTCPVCAAEPDFSVITTERRAPAGVRPLPRAVAFDPIACPYCGNDDRATHQVDGHARRHLSRDDLPPCGRYIKALDARKATRPLLPYVDPIATLPLDAAVMQQESAE